jgi:hypothetical protein
MANLLKDMIQLYKSLFPGEPLEFDHTWKDLGVVEEEGVEKRWQRRRIQCVACDEERLVYWLLDYRHEIRDRCPAGVPA